MAPEVEFDNSRLANRRLAMQNYIHGKERRGDATVLIENSDMIVAIHRDKILPTVIYPIRDTDGEWINDRAFGSQDVLDEMQKFIDEKGKPVLEMEKEIRRVMADHIERNGGW